MTPSISPSLDPFFPPAPNTFKHLSSFLFSLPPPTSFISYFLTIAPTLAFFPHPSCLPSSLRHCPPPPSLRARSLIASCCYKSNYIGVVSMGNRPPPFPTSSHTAAIALPHKPQTLHRPNITFLFSPLSLKQNEQIKYVATLETVV